MIELKNLSKSFSTADGTVEALKNVNLTIADGDIYGIIGMSGAGKSTLVRCINMLERPTEGAVLIDGRDIGKLPDGELRKVRRNITMIFQGFNLLMQRTCLKNVCFPLELSGMKRADAKKRAMELLEIVGLPDKANAFPAQLSGGQKQRIAIARALATDPKVLLCDEATSALDVTVQKQILELLIELKRNENLTVLFISHDLALVQAFCDHVMVLNGGKMMEYGTTEQVIDHPKTDYTRTLIESVL